MKIELKYLETGKGIEIGLSEKKSHKMENSLKYLKTVYIPTWNRLKPS